LNLDSQLDIIAPSASLFTLLAQNAPTNCTPPGSANLAAKICLPGAGATTGKTFTVRAAGDSPAGVARMQLWIDGNKVFELWGDQLSRSVTVAPGSHRITVRAYDRYVGSNQKTVNLTSK